MACSTISAARSSVTPRYIFCNAAAFAAASPPLSLTAFPRKAVPALELLQLLDLDSEKQQHLIWDGGFPVAKYVTVSQPTLAWFLLRPEVGFGSWEV